MAHVKIGVFDSGIGGKAIAHTLQTEYPEAEILYVNDSKNVPYGNRASSEILALTDNAIQPLLQAKVDVIVIACNTATAVAIEVLRGRYPDTQFVGLEPMVKPASEMTKSKTIAVFATSATIASERYAELKQEYAKEIRVLEPDCSNWAYLIENDQVDTDSVVSIVESVCDDGADVIVLACTHYHWIKELIIKASQNRAIIIDPSEAISRRVGQLIVY